jgi:hypothetical protein
VCQYLLFTVKRYHTLTITHKYFDSFGNIFICTNSPAPSMMCFHNFMHQRMWYPNIFLFISFWSMFALGHHVRSRTHLEMVNLLAFRKKFQLQDIARWSHLIKPMVTPTYVLLVEPQELLGKLIHFCINISFNNVLIKQSCKWSHFYRICIGTDYCDL